MSKICRVCTREFGGGTCPYCHYTNAVVLTESALEPEEKAAKIYREKLVSSLKNFSVNAVNFLWNERARAFEETNRPIIPLGDGADFDGIVKWAGARFAQSPLEVIPPLKLNIFYEYKGTKSDAAVQIQPVRCKDYWRIGLKLDPDLSLRVLLGTEDHFAEATTDLKF